MKYIYISTLWLAILFLTSLGRADFNAQSDKPYNDNEQVKKKLKSMVIDKFDFENVDIESALNYLTVKSKDLDTDRIGLKFILRLPADAPLNSSGFHRKINMTLEGESIYDILHYLSDQTNLYYEVKDSSIIFYYTLNNTDQKNAVSANKAIAFTHILSWGPWNGKFGDETPLVFIDGKSIGSLAEAYPALNSLNVGSQDHIKIEIPKVTDLHAPRHGSIYSFGRFVSTWVNKGVHLHFFQGDREYKLHTLTWSKYFKDTGGWKDDLTTAHLVFDNQDIGQIDAGLNKLKQMTWDKDIILQIYSPYIVGGQMHDGLVAPDGLFNTAYQLSDKYGFVVEDITPSE